MLEGTPRFIAIKYKQLNRNDAQVTFTLGKKNSDEDKRFLTFSFKWKEELLLSSKRLAQILISSRPTTALMKLIYELNKDGMVLIIDDSKDGEDYQQAYDAKGFFEVMEGHYGTPIKDACSKT